MCSKPVWVFVVYVVLDLICIGMGMGVPIFCILLGFPVGWFLVKYIASTSSNVHEIMRKVLRYALLTSLVTLVGMVLVWGTSIIMLSDPTLDLANYGIPMILYEPLASFIGWMALMILISPFLQLLASIFAAYLTLVGWVKNRAAI